MNSIKLLSTILGFISFVVPTINEELVTVDGQCPDIEGKMDSIATPDNMQGIFYIVEDTALGDLTNTAGRVLLTPESDGNTVTIRQRYKPKSADQCSERQLKLTYLGKPLFYNVSLQAEADSKFQDGYKGYVLELKTFSTNKGDIGIYTVILFICRDISDSQFEFDLSVYSLSALFPVRDEVRFALASNDLLELDEYIKPESQKEECLFSDEEENADYSIL